MTRSSNQRVSREFGWWRSHSHASWIIVVRSRGLPAFATPCSRSIDPLLRRRGEPGVSGELSSIGEVSEQAFRVEDRSELRANPLDVQQHCRWRRCRCGLLDDQHIPLSVYRLELFKQ